MYKIRCTGKQGYPDIPELCSERPNHLPSGKPYLELRQALLPSLEGCKVACIQFSNRFFITSLVCDARILLAIGDTSLSIFSPILLPITTSFSIYSLYHVCDTSDEPGITTR